MLSIILPTRNEPFLQKTIDTLLEKSKGEVEILPALDHYKPDPPLKKDRRVRPLYRETERGIRGGVNHGVREAKGEYIMKIDAHCLVAEGYDVELTSSCKENWLMIPRRYSLNPDKWKRQKLGTFVDYEHFTYPYYKGKRIHMATIWWQKRRNERRNKPEYDIDENMTFQGSCWVANKKYFKERVGVLNTKMFGEWPGEPQEIGMKYWLGGGKIMTNKRTWYAHLFKGRRFKCYPKSTRDIRYGTARMIDFWYNNKWKDRAHDFNWLIDRFWPVPTWPNDWKEQLKKRPIPSWREIMKINA